MEGGGFPDDAGGLAIDCWLQQAYQVSNWSTGLLMRRRVSLALHARLLNNRGACAGACVRVRGAADDDENDVGVVVEKCCYLLPRRPPSTQLPPVLTAQSRGIFSSQHRPYSSPSSPASQASLSLQPRARVCSLSVAETCPTNIRSIAVS